MTICSIILEWKTAHSLRLSCDFLHGGVNACSRLNHRGSNNWNLQLDSLEKRGKKRTLLPTDERFLTMARLRVNIPEKVLSG